MPKTHISKVAKVWTPTIILLSSQTRNSLQGPGLTKFALKGQMLINPRPRDEFVCFDDSKKVVGVQTFASLEIMFLTHIKVAACFNFRIFLAGQENTEVK